MVRVGIWNANWARPGTDRARRVKAQLAVPGCDVLCVTKGNAWLMPMGGHVIDSGIDFGYPGAERRRSVLLWSLRRWTDVDTSASGRLPGRGFVAGCTRTDVGPVVVVGVRIPWGGVLGSQGHVDRRQWQKHERWPAEFEVLRYRHATTGTVVLADFSRRIPRWREYAPRYARLRHTFEAFEFVTRAETEEPMVQAMEHIAHTPDLAPVGDIGIWSRRGPRDESLSNRTGVWADLGLSKAVERPASEPRSSR